MALSKCTIAALRIPPESGHKAVFDGQPQDRVWAVPEDAYGKADGHGHGIV